jgi:hypothetical protein
VQEQKREQSALIAAAERQSGAGVDDLERAEDPEVHELVVPAGLRAEQRPLAID